MLKIIGKALAIIFLAQTAVSYAANVKNNDSWRHNGAYVNMGGSYLQNIAAGNVSKVITDPDDPDPVVVIHNNSSRSKGSGLAIDSGYRWLIAPHWSWSLGGELAYSQMQIEGNFYLERQHSFNDDYQYSVGITQLGVVGRLFYDWQKWSIYGELSSGAAFLSSEDYANNTPNSFTYADKRVTNPYYGAAIGVLHNLTAQSSINFNIGYTDFGKAKLGENVSASGSVTPDVEGRVEQHLKVMSATISFVHWF